MTATVNSIGEVEIFTALRAWIQDVIGATVEVIQELDNRVPTPKNGFIVMSRINQKQLGQSSVEFTDTVVGTVHTVEIVTINQGVDYGIQLDCYGPLAANWSLIITSLFDTAQACDFLVPFFVTPLYVGDPKHSQFIDGGKQYQHRWTIDVHLQYNPSVSLAQQFASSVEVDLINVDVVYPPTA